MQIWANKNINEIQNAFIIAKKSKQQQQQQQENKNTQQRLLPLPQTFPDACRGQGVLQTSICQPKNLKTKRGKLQFDQGACVTQQQRKRQNKNTSRTLNSDLHTYS